MKLPAYSLLFTGICIITLVVALLVFFLAPPQIPLWYSLSISEQQLENKIFIFIFPLLITIISLLHSLFMKRVQQLDSYLRALFFYSSVVPIAILCIALIHIASVIL